MLTQVAEGVLVHESAFLRSHAVVVEGAAGVLVVDAGIQEHELECLADDLRALGQPVVAGFSTHPHWDHLLWHPSLGKAPRYATALCAATVSARLPDAAAKARVADMLPPELVGQVPLDLLGIVEGLAAGTNLIPWDGPDVRILEHQAHAPGHASLVIGDGGVLVAGDMLSDVLVPMLDLNGGVDPVGDYLAALQLLEGVADDVDVLVPGHGSVARGPRIRRRIEQDRAYVIALRDNAEVDDPRISEAVEPGWEWVRDLHSGQAQRLAEQRS